MELREFINLAEQEMGSNAKNVANLYKILEKKGLAGDLTPEDARKYLLGYSSGYGAGYREGYKEGIFFDDTKDISFF